MSKKKPKSVIDLDEYDDIFIDLNVKEPEFKRVDLEDYSINNPAISVPTAVAPTSVRNLERIVDCPRCTKPLVAAIAIDKSESQSFKECPECGTLVNTFKPTIYQAEFLSRPERYKLTGGGYGCHSPESKILMHNGHIKEAQDIRVGELLMGPDSKPRKVLELHKGVQPRYAVHIQNARVPQTPLYFNEEHIMHLEYYNYKEGYHAHGHHVYDGQFSNPTIKEYMSKSKRYKANHMWVFSGPLDMPEQSVPIDPYTFGLYLGDGCVTKKEKIALTSNDQVIIDYLETVAEDYGLLLSQYSKKGTNTKSLVFKYKERRKGSNDFQNDMERTGIIGCNSHSKFIPDVYMFNSLSNRRKLLAGILDTDGHYRGGNFEITLASEQLIKDIKYVAQSLGIRTTYRNKIVNGNTYYRLFLRGPELLNIPTLLERKQATNTPNKRHHLQRFKVEKVSDAAEYVGFTVDQDNLYVEGEHFTVIHNSGKSRGNIEDVIKHLLLIPNARVGVFARTYPALDATFVKEFQSIFPEKLVRKKNDTKREMSLTNGSELLYRSFDDPTKLKSMNLTMAVIVEASDTPESGFEMLQSRIRNGAAMIPEFDTNGNVVREWDDAAQTYRVKIKHDARHIGLETNPDSGWVKGFMLDSHKVDFYGSAYDEGYRFNPTPDKNKYTQVVSTDANPYLPPTYEEEQTRGKSEAYVRQFYRGSFQFSDNLVFPNVGLRIVAPHPLPRAFDEQGRRVLYYMIGLDYGIADPTHAVFAAYSTEEKKVYVFDEMRINNSDVKTIAKEYRKTFMRNGTDIDGLLMMPRFDGRSYNKRESTLVTIREAFEAEGLYFEPSFYSHESRIMKMNALINHEQIEIFSNCEFLVNELINYKYKINNRGLVTKTPEDKNDHGITALEFIVVELPTNLKELRLSAYVPTGTNFVHDKKGGRPVKKNIPLWDPFKEDTNGHNSNNHTNNLVSKHSASFYGAAHILRHDEEEDDDPFGASASYGAYIPRGK